VPVLHLSPYVVAALVVAILGTIQLGLFPSLLLNLAQDAARELLGS
jgi:hypothetical protein